MKFKIVAEDKKKGKIEVPISWGEIAMLFDLKFMICPDCIQCLKDNKIDKYFWKLVKKTDYLMDIKYDGGFGQIVEDRNTKSGYRFKRSKEKFYMHKKPEWKK